MVGVCCWVGVCVRDDAGCDSVCAGWSWCLRWVKLWDCEAEVGVTNLIFSPNFIFI